MIHLQFWEELSAVPVIDGHAIFLIVGRQLLGSLYNQPYDRNGSRLSLDCRRISFRAAVNRSSISDSVRSAISFLRRDSCRFRWLSSFCWAIRKVTHARHRRRRPFAGKTAGQSRHFIIGMRAHP